MKNKKNTDKLPTSKIVNEDNDKLKGYPLYPSKEDIYHNFKKEENINPDDLSKLNKSDEITGKNNELDFEDDLTDGDLDIPGSELDDQQENIGSEDEENNHYSIGGDNHDNLEEDKGE